MAHAGVSVCICTFRRPDGIRAALQSVRGQVGCAILEVIVVDNDSAGSARWILDELSVDFPTPLRYVVEERSGVGHARNRAVLEAKGGWIAFIDDDEIAEPEWLSELWRQREKSNADGVFGPVLAALPATGTPDWLAASGFYQRQRRTSGILVDWRDCASGNVLFRRQLFFRVNGFDPVFASSGGEDSDFFWRCLDTGARFVWCDSAVAQETIPPIRMTKRWLFRRSFIAGHNYVRLRARRFGRHIFIRDACFGLLALVLFGSLSLAFQVVGNKGAVTYQCKAIAGLGKISAAFPVKTVYGMERRKTLGRRLFRQ